MCIRDRINTLKESLALAIKRNIKRTIYVIYFLLIIINAELLTLNIKVCDVKM